MKKSVKNGKLFVVSAPSGSGKTTLCKKILDDGVGLVPSISYTTRKPRPGEKKGVDYHFVSEKKFFEMVKRKEFVEYEENFGAYYGTPKKALKKIVDAGKNALLSIDVKGAMRIKHLFPNASVLVFIVPPSMAILKKRLMGRRSDEERAIATRLALAKKELLYKKRYDYRIINDSLDVAYRRLKRVIASELA